MPTADCIPITAAPGLSRLFLDYCAGSDSVRPFYAGRRLTAQDWQRRPAVPAHWPELVEHARGAESLRDGGAGHRVSAAGRGRGGHRTAGGALRRSAVYALQSGDGHCACAPGHGGGASARRHLLAGQRRSRFRGDQSRHLPGPPRTAQAGLRSERRKLRGRWAEWCWTNRSRRSSTRRGNCSALRMRWTRWPRHTSPAAHSRRRSRISMQRCLRRRAC